MSINGEQLWQECRPAVEETGYSFSDFEQALRGIHDSLPKIFLENCQLYASEIAMRKKDYGIWNSFTWAEVLDHVSAMAIGLKSLGIKRGDKVTVIGDNDPEWYWAELAIQSLGAVCIGLYIDAMPSDIEHIVTDSETVLAFAKDQEQVDKFIDIKEAIPNVFKIIYWDERGMLNYQSDDWLMNLAELESLGKQSLSDNPDAYETEVAKGHIDELAVISYTSGTTSLPKGAMLSQKYLVKMSARIGSLLVPQRSDNYLSFVPPAWVTEQLMLANWLIVKNKVNFPEKPETVMTDLREIGARIAFLGPMQWQDILSQVQMKIFDTGPIRKLIYSLSLKIGYWYADKKSGANRPSLWTRLAYRLADLLCLLHIRDYFGLSKLRFGLTGGTALGPDVIRWFNAIGVVIKEGYGLTEMTPGAVHRSLIKPGTSGPPAPGVEIRVQEDGEIQVRSDAMFVGYYKAPEKTRESLTDDGWIRTGDCGTFDEDGHLVIYDRMKDMLPLKGGGQYSPTFIQNRLKFSPYIKEAMVVGGENRDTIFAILTIDFDNVGKWAEKNRIAYTTFVDLSQKDEVYKLIEKDIDRVNRNLPENVRIYRYSLLHKEFDPDEAELTRSRKIRRGFLEKRYADLIDAAYQGMQQTTIEGDITYQDGRQRKTQTDLKIKTVATGG